jgi:hypothetical protein
MDKETIVTVIQVRIKNKNADIKAMADGGQFIQAHELKVARDELINLLAVIGE